QRSGENQNGDPGRRDRAGHWRHPLAAAGNLWAVRNVGCGGIRVRVRGGVFRQVLAQSGRRSQTAPPPRAPAFRTAAETRAGGHGPQRRTPTTVVPPRGSRTLACGVETLLDTC